VFISSSSSYDGEASMKRAKHDARFWSNAAETTASSSMGLKEHVE